jgi:5'-methylthioadenosine phosphorylase
MSQWKIGLIGGTGLGAALLVGADGIRHDIDTPFGRTSDSIVETQWEGIDVLLLNRHGPGHLLNPSAVPFRANIFALKQLGCTHIIASGAVGSLRQEFAPRDLVVPDQVIDRTFRRTGTFFEKAAVHVEFAEPFCPVLRRVLIEEGTVEFPVAAGTTGASAMAAAHGGVGETPARGPMVHGRGCYVCMEGPAFSSRAESLMHRLWGGDLIGMTAMPEAKLAREAEIPYAQVSLVTDYDCWRNKPAAAASQGNSAAAPQPASDPAVLIEEILANVRAATENATRLIRRTLRRLAADGSILESCPARSALRLAIWSDKSRIDLEEIRRLGPLWGRYFDAAALLTTGS